MPCCALKKINCTVYHSRGYTASGVPQNKSWEEFSFHGATFFGVALWPITIARRVTCRKMHSQNPKKRCSWWGCRILTSFSLGGSYPRLLGRGKLWTTASFPYLGDGCTQLQPVRHWYFSRTSDVTLSDYGRAVGHSR